MILQTSSKDRVCCFDVHKSRAQAGLLTRFVKLQAHANQVRSPLSIWQGLTRLTCVCISISLTRHTWLMTLELTTLTIYHTLHTRNTLPTLLTLPTLPTLPHYTLVYDFYTLYYSIYTFYIYIYYTHYAIYYLCYIPEALHMWYIFPTFDLMSTTKNRKQGASWTSRAAAAIVRKNSSEIAPRTLSKIGCTMDYHYYYNICHVWVVELYITYCKYDTSWLIVNQKPCETIITTKGCMQQYVFVLKYQNNYILYIVLHYK